MCGIAGIIGPGACSESSRAALARMTRTLAPRGPDEESFWFDPDGEAALGFRRLAILDIDGGHQPAANEDATVHVVFNGEIYNFPELQHRLEALGHHLSGRGDTATLPHLYEEEGPAFINRLRGMFAIAVWDSNKKRLTLCRDRFGQKPLVYRLTESGQLHFASELKALRAADPQWRPEIDPIALDHYLALGYVPAPRTIYSGVFKLPAAHLATYCKNRLEIRPYWKIDWSQTDSPVKMPVNKARLQFRELLEDAVREQNVADVPVGVFLSGGIDSSMIAASSARALSGRPIRSFSVSFDDVAFDESAQAEQFARQLNADHTTIRVDFNAWETLQSLASAYDEPFADNSALPTWILARETARHLKVVLSGDGGDELALGYDRYRAIAIVEKARRYLPQSLIAFLSGPLSNRIPVSSRAKTRGRRVQALLRSLGLSEMQLLSKWLVYWDEPNRLELYRPETLDRLVAAASASSSSASAPGTSLNEITNESVDPMAFLRTGIASASRREWVRHAQAADVSSMGYLPGDLMYKVDIATMAHSLECRSPFLDHRLAEFGARLPVKYWLESGTGRGKRLFRETCTDLVPREVFRRRKMGFGAPVDRWLAGPLADRMAALLTGPDARVCSMLDREKIARTITAHRTGQSDHAYRLWNLLMLEFWMQSNWNSN